MNLVLLVGFMGAGKTSVGRALAARLHWRFYDLDEEIERAAGCTVGDVFRDQGETEFRRRETEALRQLLNASHRPAVIALGGGALAQPQNAELIGGAPTVFLDAPIEELWRRCQEHSVERPLRRDFDEFRQLFESRRKAYSTAAVTVHTAGKSVEEVAAEVARRAGLIDKEK